MTLIIVGGTGNGPTPPPGLETAANVECWSPQRTETENAIGGLAAALTAFEAEVNGREIESIVLVDDSDAALAASLVGAKLPVEVAATADARNEATANGRLIAQLADAYTAPA